jgi:transcription initiation factor TFIID subunit 9B
MSKEFLMETAQARNKVALPRVLQNEWGVRLPSERFVLSGVPWGLKEEWETEDEGAAEGMEGVETTEEQGVEGGEEGGDMSDIFGGDMDQDMEQE